MTARHKTGREPGYTMWRPYRDGEILLCRVHRILQEYEANLPLTCRQIYYRLIGTYPEYPKAKRFEAKVYDLLANARRTRHPRVQNIPFGHIRDDGIRGQGIWDKGLDDFLKFQDGLVYDLDQQTAQNVRLEVWCEAAGMMPQLARVANEFSVPVYSCGGFNSLTSVRETVDHICSEGRDTVVLHLGDYDPSGVCLYESFVEDVQSFLQEDAPEVLVESVRVALTEEQIAEYDLPGEPPDKKDPRTAAWEAEEKGLTSQLEALPPDVIATLLREQIEERMDEEVRQQTIEREHLERAALKSVPARISILPGLESRIKDRPIELLYPTPCRSIEAA